VAHVAGNPTSPPPYPNNSIQSSLLWHSFSSSTIAWPLPSLPPGYRHISSCRRCQFLLFSGYDFCYGGPLAGVKETIRESPLWLHARR
jgi:hypothetical protein